MIPVLSTLLITFVTFNLNAMDVDAPPVKHSCSATCIASFSNKHFRSLPVSSQGNTKAEANLLLAEKCKAEAQRLLETEYNSNIYKLWRTSLATTIESYKREKYTFNVHRACL